LVVTASLAACSSSSGSSNGSGGGGSKSSSGSFPTSAAGLYAAAKKEGEVVWYTASSDPELAAGFEKAYPGIKVDVVAVSGTGMVTRLGAEQKGDKFTADVVNGVASSEIVLKNANALQPYTPPDQAPLPTGITLPTGYNTVAFALTTVITYNPKTVAKLGIPAPTTVSDFANPKWSHQVSIDPIDVEWYLDLAQSLGSQSAAKALMQKVGKNNPLFVSSHTSAVMGVQAGDPAAAISAYGYKVAPLAKKDPTDVALVNPNPLPTILNLINLVRNAPHPNAARLLIDWLASKAGQEVVVNQTGRTSLRPDVVNDPTIWDPSKWKPEYANPNLTPDQYNSITDEFDSAIGYK
jgi:iron(III) transport system substrate-binding protein